jgi:hypothetical protein
MASHDGSQFPVRFRIRAPQSCRPQIEDKIFRKPRFDPGFAKSLRHSGEGSDHGTPLHPSKALHILKQV